MNLITMEERYEMELPNSAILKGDEKYRMAEMAFRRGVQQALNMASGLSEYEIQTACRLAQVWRVDKAYRCDYIRHMEREVNIRVGVHGKG